MDESMKQFTLTAEEVEIVQHYLTSTLRYEVFLGHNLDKRQSTKLKELEKILTRIIQWQDENQ